MCGEHEPNVSSTCAAMGSSPRVRGTRRLDLEQERVTGIIPACAGNTAPRALSCTAAWDHPRVCGEHTFITPLRASFWGSSPRVRGTPEYRQLPVHVPGIIPACAGNTIVGGGSIEYARDHPRVCGEHQTNLANQQTMQGSSPRVRGTPHSRRYPTRRTGIIPACAGNTTPSACSRTIIRDHPRVCGEHKFRRSKGYFRSGSSPRVRGTRCTVFRPCRLHGIIPACAGNTEPGRSCYMLRWDHPRVCGEHTPMTGSPTLAPGSSPRVRGTRDCHTAAERDTGIIPACAGNTGRPDHRPSCYWDHPRVCGEHRVPQDGEFKFQGSSPRVRGTRDVQSVGLARRGIIPACAGNTPWSGRR